MLTRPSTLAGLPWSVAALALTLIPAAGSDAGTRDLRVLYIPSDASSTNTIRARDLRGEVAGQRVDILRVSKKNAAGDTPVIVVLDFANTSPANWACLAAEIAPFANLAGNHRFDVFITAADVSPFYLADFGSGASAAIPLFAIGSGERWERNCAGRKRGEYLATGHPLGYSGLIDALTARLPAVRGPYRVIWIAEYFGNLAGRFLPPAFRTPQDGERVFEGEDLPEHIEESSELSSRSALSGISIFPVVIPPVSRHSGEGGRVSGFNRRASRLVAETNGGFVEFASGKPGETLARVLEKTSAGYVLELRTPQVGPKWYNGLPHLLKISDGGTFHMRRPLVLGGDSDRNANEVPDLEPFRLRFPTNQIRVHAGCPGRDSGDWIRLETPTRGELRVLIDYDGWFRQRMSFDRSARGKPRAPMCVELIKSTQATRFHVIAMDEANGWIGALDGQVLRLR